MNKLKEMEEFNKDLLKLMSKYQAEFVVDFGYDSDIRSIDVQLPEGWICYDDSESRLPEHNLNNPRYQVED